MISATAGIAQLIQSALAPAFILAGLATLVSTLTTRLGRVSDRVDTLSVGVAADPAAEALRRHRLQRLALRSQFLDVAVVLSASASAAIAASVAALFIAASNGRIGVEWSAGFFLGALALTVGALTLFTIEVLMAGRDLRAAAER